MLALGGRKRLIWQTRKRSMVLMLFLIAVLVAVSTALVGPVSLWFVGIGLSLSADAYLSSCHSDSSCFFIGSGNSVSGQLVFEHLLGMQAVLSVVVEFLGGIVFIVFLMRRKSL